MMDQTTKKQPSTEQATSQREVQQPPTFETTSPRNITSRSQIYALQRQIGNQAVQRLLKVNSATVQREKKRKADVLDEHPSKRLKGMPFEQYKNDPFSGGNFFEKPFQYNFSVSSTDFGLHDKKRPRRPRMRDGTSLRLNSRNSIKQKQFTEIFMPQFSSMFSPFGGQDKGKDEIPSSFGETMDLTEIGQSSSPMGENQSMPNSFSWGEDTKKQFFEQGMDFTDIGISNFDSGLGAPINQEIQENTQRIEIDEEAPSERIDTTPIPNYPIYQFTVHLDKLDDEPQDITPSDEHFDDMRDEENAFMGNLSMPFGNSSVPEMSLESMDEKEDVQDEDMSSQISDDKVGLREGVETDSVSHTIYAGTYRKDDKSTVPTLIIQSYPLPIGVFIGEMGSHYRNFDTKLKLSKAKKKPTVITPTKLNNFTKNESTANKAVKEANKIFANTKKLKKLFSAEERVAQALNPVIKATTTAAKGISEHYAVDANRPKVGKHKRFTKVKVTGKGKSKNYYYLNKVSLGRERYRLEGLVTSYETQPDYLKSGLERDHQPHNALVEMMSELDEFNGRKIEKAAAGRSAEVMTIMLHHNRHAKGRTYGAKGGKVTREAKAEIVKERKKLAGAIFNELKSAHDKVSKLKKPNKAASDLQVSLKDAYDSAKTAKTSGKYEDLKDAMDHLKDATKQKAAATFNNVKFANSDFNNAEKLVDAYAETMREFCIELMVNSLKADAAAIKNVAASASNFGDVKAMKLSKAKETKLIQKIRDQVDEGEGRMLDTESIVRGYADP